MTVINAMTSFILFSVARKMAKKFFGYFVYWNLLNNSKVVEA